MTVGPLALSRIGEVSGVDGSGLVGFNVLWFTFENNTYVALKSVSKCQIIQSCHMFGYNLGNRF